MKPARKLKSGTNNLSGISSESSMRTLPGLNHEVSTRISVPEELIPALKKVRTADYRNFEEHLNESEQHHIMRRCLDRIIHAPSFEYLMGIVILANMVAMIIEIDREAKTNKEVVTARAAYHWTELFGWAALLIFVLELLVRLLVYRWDFFRDSWNMFDFVIVTVDLCASLIGLLAGGTFPVSVIRIFRLAKLARAFKVLRVFPELRLLLAGLISSMSAIFWGTVLLLFCMLVWSLVAVLFIHPLNQELDYGGCERCRRAYSSVFQSTLTFWQQIVTGDSWGQTTIPVIEEHPGTAVFFILVYLSVGMALTNLILGVVVSVAQQAQEALQEEDNAEVALFKLEQHTNLLHLCKDMDADNDGKLSEEEVFTVFNQPGEFRDSVLALDITDDEFDIVWKILDTEGKGSVSYKELVSRLSTMKVSDTQFMLAYIKYYMSQLRSQLTETMKSHHKESMEMEQHVDDLEEEILKEVEGLIEKEAQLVISHEDDSRPTNGCSNVEINIQEELGSSDTNHGATPATFDSKNGLTSTRSSPDTKCGVTPASADAEHAAKSASMDSDTQRWLEQIHQEIATLRLQLEDKFRDVNCKLEQQASLSAADDLDIKGSLAQPDLLVVPSRGSSIANGSLPPLCCKSWVPAERHVLEIPVPHGGHHHAGSSRLPITPAAVRR